VEGIVGVSYPVIFLQWATQQCQLELTLRCRLLLLSCGAIVNNGNFHLVSMEWNENLLNEGQTCRRSDMRCPMSVRRHIRYEFKAVRVLNGGSYCHPACTNPGRQNFVRPWRMFLVKLLHFVPYTHKNVYQFTCTEQKATGNCEVHSAPQNCGPSAWNLFHISLLAHRIWRYSTYYMSKKFVNPCCRRTPRNFHLGRVGGGLGLTMRIYNLFDFKNFVIKIVSQLYQLRGVSGK
jgi:hypothetical protein